MELPASLGPDSCTAIAAFVMETSGLFAEVNNGGSGLVVDIAAGAAGAPARRGADEVAFGADAVSSFKQGHNEISHDLKHPKETAKLIHKFLQI